MQFKDWLLKEEQEISQPYYRVVNNAIYGGNAKEKLGDVLAPGTYWTPRWNAVQQMLRTTLIQYSSSKTLPDEYWLTTIYQLNKAIMTDPPKEHKWAFNYSVDAGEQVLVKALDQPQIAADPVTGKPLKDIHPQDSVFISLVSSIKQEEIPVDYIKKGVEATWNGKTVYLLPSYETYSIEVVIPNGWQYQVIKVIRSLEEFNQFYKQITIKNPDSEQLDALDWFLYDLDRDARAGKEPARAWLMPGYEFGQHKDDFD